MIKKFAAAGLVAAASLSCAAASLSCVAIAQAGDFAAAPMNPGPAKVTGMGPVGEIANVALIPTNVLTPPAMTVVTTVANGTPVVEPVAAPAVRHHRHHRHHPKM